MERKRERWPARRNVCQTRDETPECTRHSAIDDDARRNASDVLRQLGACELRSAFAQAVFASQRRNFRRESDFRKAVGSWVASDIQHDVQLRMQMQALGYKPRERGYTLRQRQLLVQFYMEKGVI